MSGQKSVREQKADAKREARRRTRLQARGGPEKSLQSLFALAAGIGLSATCLIYLALRILGWADREINPEIRNLVLIISFFVTFLASVLVLIQKFYPKDEFGKRRAANKPSKFKPPQDKWGGALVPSTGRMTKVFDVTTARKVRAPATLEDGTAFDSKVKEPRPEMRGASVGLDQAPGVGSQKPQYGAIEDTESHGDKSTAPPAEDQTEELPQETLGIVLGDLRTVMASVSEVLSGRAGKLDKHSKFGLNLIFAGICSRLARHYKLSAKEGQSLLARLMELTGSNAAEARTFADQINDYGEHPQYRALIDGGDNAVGPLFSDSNKLDQEDTGEEESSSMTSVIGGLLETWEAGSDDVALPESKIFMFTEIIDSDLLAKELNEELMQRVIKTHDTSVREALNAYAGREIKHTGVGILALFDDSRAAIDAAVQMQQNVNLASRQSKEIAFDIRIGLHAGTAISKGKNFFGDSLKYAALVCNEAGGEEIWVSDTVWNACPAYADDLRYCGEFSLGGDVKELYTMLWERLPDPKDDKVDYGDIGKRSHT